MVAAHDRKEGGGLFAAPLLAFVHGHGRDAERIAGITLVVDVGLTHAINRRLRMK